MIGSKNGTIANFSNMEPETCVNSSAFENSRCKSHVHHGNAEVLKETPFAPQIVAVPGKRFTGTMALLDLELPTDEDEDGCDEIMDDTNFAAHLAAISRSCVVLHDDRSNIIFPSKQQEAPAPVLHALVAPTHHPRSVSCAPFIMPSTMMRVERRITEEWKAGSMWQRIGKSASAVPGKKPQFDPALPSVGSALHSYGRCIPCDYRCSSTEGCTMGRYCGYCHLCPPDDAAHGVHQQHEEGAAYTSRRRRSAVEFEAVVQESRDLFNARQLVARTRTHITNCVSRHHFTGACNPCIFIHKPSGCNHGEECLHCHLCDTDIFQLKKRTRVLVGKRIKEIQTRQQSITGTTISFTHERDTHEHGFEQKCVGV